MWSDNPASDDLLGFEFLSKAARRLVLDQSLHPTTIGIFGLWGSGKSCLAGMLCDSLGDQEDVLCIQFNAWTFEGFDDAKAALMDTILERLLEERKLPAKSKDLLLRLRRAVNLGSLTRLGARVAIPAAAAGLAAHDPSLALPAMQAAAMASASNITVDQAADVLKPGESSEPSRKDIREFRGDFEQLLKDAKLKTLVVFIDDLDRCLPDTIIDVLEAIRLFLATPKTVFVVCADERLVRSAVRRRFPPQPGDDFDVANEYLEKLIQHPLRISPLGAVEVRLYLALLLVQNVLGDAFKEQFKTLTSRVELEKMTTRQLVEKLVPNEGRAREEIVELVGQVADVLGVHLNGNPRQLKRFMNTLMLRMDMAEDRGFKVERPVLAKLMVLEYVKLPFFRQLFAWQAAQNGQPTQLAEMEASKPDAPSKSRKAKADSETIPEQSAADANVSLWKTDPWLSDWLKSDPQLAKQDLRPYFLLSRDRLELSPAGAEGLTAAARAALELLVAPSKMMRAKASAAMTALTQSEAASLLRVLAEQCRRASNLTGEGTPFEAAIELVKTHPELAAECMLLFQELSLRTLGLGAPPLLEGLAQAVPAMRAAIDSLLRQWGEQQVNPKLAQAAKITVEGRKA